MVEVSGNSGELPPEAASRLSAGLGAHDDDKALGRLVAERDRYRKALEKLSKECPIGDYVADVYSELSQALIVEELSLRADFAREALKDA
jgi:hypothetical protein